MAADLQDTDNLFFILYPSGSHGSFLKLLLNTLVGNEADEINGIVYDTVTYRRPCTFNATHKLTTSVDPDRVINIRVDPKSYLKYFAVCLNRTSGNNILVEDLSVDTFKKIKQHSIFSFFADSLATISGSTVEDVEPKYLREWIRLCFFANNGDTITKFILPNVLTNSKYIIDFESFYNGTILDQCRRICNDNKLPTCNDNKLMDYIEQFITNNQYYTIDQNMPKIISAIGQTELVDLSNTNILQQAWIDNYLVTQYNINPLLKNDYFTDTKELTKAYKI
jgi:hypothetical protein